jgi:hypothetical protein
MLRRLYSPWLKRPQRDVAIQGRAPGPLVANTVIGTNKNHAAGFTTVGIISLAAIVLTFITKPPHHDARKH